MDLLTRIQEHKKSQEGKFIEVPEWGEEGVALKIWVKPESLADFGAIANATEKGADWGVAETLKRLALDENGEPLFKGIGVTDLRKMASGAISIRVATQLRTIVNKDEAEGN